jgi:serine/threonine protein kinase
MANSPVRPNPSGASEEEREGEGVEQHLEVPGPFGRFQLIERIGAGGMAEVFRAEVRGPEGFRRELVIKRVLPRLGAQARFTQMFVNEAKICALLNHPNIVQIFEFGEVRGSYFIAMESVLGFTLREALTRLRARGARAPVVAALEITRALLGALDYAHNLVDWAGRRLDIVHRDISPSNVMLAQNGAVKVLDFGIARAADILGRPEPELSPGDERPPSPPAGEDARVVNGKIPYLAPEQLTRGAVVDHRVDVFAVGCVLFELLTGRPLFRCQSDLAKKMALLHQPSPAPSAFNPEVPPAVDAIVARAVERSPDARYGSAVAMLADVESFLASRRSSDRAVLRLVRSLDDRAASGIEAGETFLTSSARVVRPVLVDPPIGAASSRPPAPGAPGRGSESPIARSTSSPGQPPGTVRRTSGESWRGSGRFLGLVAALALLLVAVGLHLHARDADRSSGQRAPAPAAGPAALAPGSAPDPAGARASTPGRAPPR